MYLELRLGKKISEGKTKEVYELPDHPGCVLMQSKDQITAGNAARKDHMEGKASISNKTTSCIFKLLQEAGKNYHLVYVCGLPLVAFIALFIDNLIVLIRFFSTQNLEANGSQSGFLLLMSYYYLTASAGAYMWICFQFLSA